MLRGPQTLNELKTHSHRLYDFDDLDDVQFALQQLIDREPSMVIALPRQAGQKEGRFAHLLSGEPDIPTAPVREIKVAGSSVLVDRIAALEEQLEEIRDRLCELEK
jgi:uncharacterized protein YceH (UPF0502 family)